jgi:hypothetical protein
MLPHNPIPPMASLYVTSSHYRTPSGCPGISPVLSLLERTHHQKENPFPADPAGPPLRPSASTLRKMTQRFKPRV